MQPLYILLQNYCSAQVRYLYCAKKTLAPMKTCRLLLFTAFLLTPLAASAHRGSEDGRSGHAERSFGEEYRDGRCKVKRKLEKNGSYKEERECKAGRNAYPSQEYDEEYRDGNCKVKRKLDKNGDYKEERECETQRHR